MANQNTRQARGGPIKSRVACMSPVLVRVGRTNENRSRESEPLVRGHCVNSSNANHPRKREKRYPGRK